MYKVSRPDYMVTVSILIDIEFVNTPGSFNVTSVNLLKPPTKEGYNVNATVVLKNPTPFSVEMVCFFPRHIPLGILIVRLTHNR